VWNGEEKKLDEEWTGETAGYTEGGEENVYI
jgi:hypothetical protein